MTQCHSFTCDNLSTLQN